MPLILTTRGHMDTSALARTLGFEDRPDLLAVWVEYRADGDLVRRDAYPLPKDASPTIATVRGVLPVQSLTRTIEITDSATDIAVAVRWSSSDGELVRRDAHVIVKQAGVVADAMAAALG